MMTEDRQIKDRFCGCLLGLACGDAVGTTVEFKPRGSFLAVTDLVGGGPFHLKTGEWTDDTSMALCLATSLIEKQGFDADDQMKRYERWHRQGYLSSNGRCFDIGNTIAQALLRYQVNGDPFSGSSDSMSAGNGSIMRLAPVVMFYYPDTNAIWHYSVESSRTTHGAAECLDACRLLGNILYRALNGASKDEILIGTQSKRLANESIQAIARGEYRKKTIDNIRGSGYVVESLEAALWCFSTTESFESAILQAANLGDDADTTAAICGQVAGAFYGESGIPSHWLKKLVMGKEIGDLAKRLFQESKRIQNTK